MPRPRGSGPGQSPPPPCIHFPLVCIHTPLMCIHFAPWLFLLTLYKKSHPAFLHIFCALSRCTISVHIHPGGDHPDAAQFLCTSPSAAALPRCTVFVQCPPCPPPARIGLALPIRCRQRPPTLRFRRRFTANFAPQTIGAIALVVL